MPGWRNWQTRTLEGRVGIARGGSIPPPGTIFLFSSKSQVSNLKFQIRDRIHQSHTSHSSWRTENNCSRPAACSSCLMAHRSSLNAEGKELMVFLGQVRGLLFGSASHHPGILGEPDVVCPSMSSDRQVDLFRNLGVDGRQSSGSNIAPVSRRQTQQAWSKFRASATISESK